VEGDLQRVVGRHVRRIRVDRGISQEALADALGYHRTYLGGIERGERNLTLRSVERLAEGLAVDVRVLLETSEKSEMS
jgi:transcriptional regulator with XRE-family HTH domain